MIVNAELTLKILTTLAYAKLDITTTTKLKAVCA